MSKDEIISSRIVLQPVTKNDMEDLHTLLSFKEVARYNTIGIPKNLETTATLHEDMINNPDYLGWTIRLTNAETFIGLMGMRLAPKRFKSAEIHYSFLPEYWGQGYATESVKAILAHAFEELDLHRIEAGCAVNNLASIAVLEKCGFTKEGQKRKVLPLSTGWSDNFEYAILKEDFDKLQT